MASLVLEYLNLSFGGDAINELPAELTSIRAGLIERLKSRRSALGQEAESSLPPGFWRHRPGNQRLLVESDALGTFLMRGIGRIFRRGPIYWVAYNHRSQEHRESSQSDNESVARKLPQESYRRSREWQFIGPNEERLSFEEVADCQPSGIHCRLAQTASMPAA